MAIPRFETHRRVRFAETDASGHAHFSTYVRLMEETEYAFLRSRGLSVVLYDERGTMGFPRLSVEFKIHRAAVRDELIFTTLEMTNIDGKAIVYQFELVDEQAALVALGAFRVACCRFPADAPPYAILTPEHVIHSLTCH